MPYKDAAAQREFNRKRAQLRRERAKEAEGAIKAEGGASAARVNTPPTLVKPDVVLPSGQPPAAQPAPTIPATTPAASPDDNRKRLSQKYAESKAERDGKPTYIHRTKDEVQAQRETSGMTSTYLATETHSVQAKPPIQTSPTPSEPELDALVELILSGLDSKGFYKLQVGAFNDDIVILRANEKVTGYPDGYPVYTRAELEKCGQLGLESWYLIHATKKITQASLNL